MKRTSGEPASRTSRRTFLGMSAGAAGLLAGTAGLARAEGSGTAPASAPAATPAASGDESLLCLPGIPVAVDYDALRTQRMTEVDPEMRAIYDQVAAGPSIREIGIDAIRKSGQTPANAVVPPGVTARNIEIPGPAGPIPTRIWMPEGVREPVGVYLSTHGGGWNFGNGMEYHDAEEGQHVLDWGCAVVRPDYRIAPEHKFPAAIEDCYAALTYLGRHGRSLGLDPTRIGVGGGCAGGNIGTVISLMARDAGEVTPAIQFLWSPACDMRNNYRSHLEFGSGYGLRLDDADFVSQNYLPSREASYDWRASPILAPTLKGAPPALVWVGEWEILHDETMAYVDRMRDAGVKVHLIEGPQQGHGFIYLYPQTAYSRTTRPKIDAIMRSYIGPRRRSREKHA
ncbi:alpha/beta hydrolase [Actinacidiphila sp. DG2A-62]|uniref:alpha/beta hydrolase n=1 Tax=Actinacidiphila sp. DG2A-62 TaxID=3108821 RepID=UPI002DB8E303|nr:alpha/beta hydrolase [Actinacidiphila sp. DG2A-62]MEC3993753.1 alpha/beta hydrolase [Actinacidiphila sp. DG2A-62]